MNTYTRIFTEDCPPPSQEDQKDHLCKVAGRPVNAKGEPTPLDVGAPVCGKGNVYDRKNKRCVPSVESVVRQPYTTIFEDTKVQSKIGDAPSVENEEESDFEYPVKK